MKEWRRERSSLIESKLFFFRDEFSVVAITVTVSFSYSKSLNLYDLLLLLLLFVKYIFAP